MFGGSRGTPGGWWARRQQRRQRAEQAGAVLPQADHVERVRPQHRRQPRHAVVHRRRQLFQQPAQAALRHGLMGHRDRRQLVDFLLTGICALTSTGRVGQLGRLAAGRQVPRDGRDDVTRIRQQPPLAQALGGPRACCGRCARDQPAEQRVGLLMRANVAQQLGEAANRAGLSLDSGRWRSTRASASSTCRSLTRRVARSARSPGHRGIPAAAWSTVRTAFVQARGFHSRSAEADQNRAVVITRQRLRAQVVLGDLDPARSATISSAAPGPGKVGLGVLAIGGQGRIHALRLAFSIHTWQRWM